MITVEKQKNTETNYLKLWCATCMTTLELLNYKLEEVAPGGIELLDHMAMKHERQNHKHDIHIIEGVRRPTLRELRNS
jgi:hypothetical protein